MKLHHIFYFFISTLESSILRLCSCSTILSTRGRLPSPPTTVTSHTQGHWCWQPGGHLPYISSWSCNHIQTQILLKGVSWNWFEVFLHPAFPAE